MRHDRSDVDDTATTGARHARREDAIGVEGSLDVDLEDAAEQVHREFIRGELVLERGCGHHEACGTAVLALDVLGELLHGRQVADVQRIRGAADLLCHRFRSLLIQVDDRHSPAALCHRLAGGGSYAVSAANNDAPFGVRVHELITFQSSRVLESQGKRAGPRVNRP